MFVVFAVGEMPLKALGLGETEDAALADAHARAAAGEIVGVPQLVPENQASMFELPPIAAQPK
jgi:hypothetical protein